uniref:Uncharacterized protein n=1 Tax=Peronospora matthiolae TaxID=2874970 RepID=A0AAV1T3K9_9STRA
MRIRSTAVEETGSLEAAEVILSAVSTTQPAAGALPVARGDALRDIGDY